VKPLAVAVLVGLVSGCTFSQLDKRDADVERQSIKLQLDCVGDCRLQVGRDQTDDEDRGKTTTDAEVTTP
jgi:hypothetical protein